jgi:glutathione S-transferase
MITVHHLADSRSQRILWLMEELELPYEIKYYPRIEQKFADPKLKELHPLGKSPIISDGDRVVVESAAIIEYILELYGNGRLRPKTGTDDWARYLQWMHLIEGSVMPPLLIAIYLEILGPPSEPLHPRIFGEVTLYLQHLADELKDRDFIVGNSLTGADIMVNFLLEGAWLYKRIEPWPHLKEYVKKMQARPAYQRALEKGGNYNLGRLHSN